MPGAHAGAGQGLSLKKEWCAHPHYIEKMKAFAPFLTGFDDATCFREALLGVMREAALESRDIIFSMDPSSQHSVLIRLSSIARAIRTQDHQLAQILCENSELGKEHLDASGPLITFKNPPLLKTKF